MGLEAAAEQLRMMEAVNKRQDEERKRKTQQEEVIYHQWATFRVDNERFGIDVMRVKEVLRYSDITPVPGSDHSILGILNLRGNVVTVIDTRTLFQLSRVEADDSTRVIVVELSEHEVIRLVVDAVDEVNRYRNLFLAKDIQEGVLQSLPFSHVGSPYSYSVVQKSLPGGAGVPFSGFLPKRIKKSITGTAPEKPI